jgi:shikimate dehydrogenase
MTRMTAPPDRYAVLGHPVAHSQSPFIHALFARQTGQHLVYDRVPCPPDGFEACVRAFASTHAADGGRARGCNVTIPFKFDAPRLARQVTARAALAQAANVLCFDPPGWLADNTDGAGLIRDLEGGAGWSLAGRRILLIGAGGAAAGVLGPLIERAPAEIVLANRTPERARGLVDRHRPLAADHRVRLAAGGLADCGRAFDIVINSSASSMKGGPIPVADAVLRDGALAVDLMYGPAAAPFLQWAEARGANPRDGLGMLVEQAAGAFALWRGVEPQTAPALAALREHLRSSAP